MFAKHNNHLGRDGDLRSTESYVLFMLKWNTQHSERVAHKGTDSHEITMDDG